MNVRFVELKVVVNHHDARSVAQKWMVIKNMDKFILGFIICFLSARLIYWIIEGE